MTERARLSTGSDRLAKALRLLQTTEENWTTDELPDLLAAQLALPASPADERPWREALLDPPALSVIVALKDIAKGWTGAKSAMPTEIARILYITAIASAERRFDTTVSQLSARQLAWHRAWALSQNWADSALLDVIRQWEIDDGG